MNGCGSPLNKNGPIYKDLPLHKPCWGAVTWMALAYLPTKLRPSGGIARPLNRRMGVDHLHETTGPLLPGRPWGAPGYVRGRKKLPAGC